MGDQLQTRWYYSLSGNIGGAGNFEVDISARRPISEWKLFHTRPSESQYRYLLSPLFPPSEGFSGALIKQARLQTIIKKKNKNPNLCSADTEAVSVAWSP